MASKRKTEAERLEDLLKKRNQIDNQIKAVKARASQEERKARNKRLIETGAEVEAALGFALETKEERLAFGNFLRDQEARGQYVTRALQKARAAAAETTEEANPND